MRIPARRRWEGKYSVGPHTPHECSAPQPRHALQIGRGTCCRSAVHPTLRGRIACVVPMLVRVGVNRVDAADEMLSVAKYGEQSGISQARITHGFQLCHHHQHEQH